MLTKEFNEEDWIFFIFSMNASLRKMNLCFITSRLKVFLRLVCISRTTRFFANLALIILKSYNFCVIDFNQKLFNILAKLTNIFHPPTTSDWNFCRPKKHLFSNYLTCPSICFGQSSCHSKFFCFFIKVIKYVLQLAANIMM